MPRVTPKRARFRPDEVVRSWQAFAADLPDGTSLTIPRGTRLRGDHPAVLACSWNFVLDSEPDDSDPNPYAVTVEPEPLFTRPTKVRVKCRVLHGTAAYDKGHVFVAPADTASWLVSEGLAEVA